MAMWLSIIALFLMESTSVPFAAGFITHVAA